MTRRQPPRRRPPLTQNEGALFNLRLDGNTGSTLRTSRELAAPLRKGIEMTTQLGTTPLAAGRHSVASYATYPEAQQAVDYLSDSGFPVEHTDVVGSDLRLVEHVTGRLTNARAAMAGAGSGAWFGLFIGLLVGLFTTGPVWLGLVLGGLVIGALWGAVFGFVAHWATRGQRDFASVSGIVAGRYDLVVSPEHADRARALLAEMGSSPRSRDAGGGGAPV